MSTAWHWYKFFLKNETAAGQQAGATGVMKKDKINRPFTRRERAPTWKDFFFVILVAAIITLLSWLAYRFFKV